MELKTLKVNIRQGKGKGPAGRTRNGGDVPGVLYGGGTDVLHVTVNTREFGKIIQGGGEHAIVQLDVQGDASLSSPALLKEVQHHPVRGHVLHADFLRIRLDERITVLVPVVLTGQCKGVVDGGVVDHQLREVEVECLALDVPASLTLDITELGIGDSCHVDKLVAPEGVSIVTDPGRAVVVVQAPRTVRAEGAEEGAAEGAEPALVGDEKKEKSDDDKS
ncbi:MAG: 50S ribosomal protein L25 [Candidatus Hydrogenedentes bacterium]|nr:50S ribosomal protein L25 [Candidatus Hydrogenedentota bacterium]